MKFDIKYNIDELINKIETSYMQKAYLSTKLGKEYIIGNIESSQLIDLGFELVSKSNECGINTPIYRLGNIEAIYIQSLLHIYEVE